MTRVRPDSERDGRNPGDGNERILIEKVTIFNYKLQSHPTPSEPRPGDENERILIEKVTIFNYNLECGPTPSEPGRK